jgi:hypothetical protein
MTTAVSAIVKILTISGLQSCRIFTPLFIYLLFICAAFDGACSSEKILHLAQITPEWLRNYIALSVCGSLSIVEVVAIYNCDVKEVYTTFVSKYLKPIVATVVAFGFLTNKDTAIVATLVDNTTVLETTGQVAGSLACGAATYAMDEVRTKVDEVVTTVAPNNEFNLQTIYNLLEDSWVFILIFFIIVIPTLALILIGLMALAAILLKFYIRKQELKNSHYCSNCQSNNVSTLVSNSAVLCQTCKQVQENICSVNFIGTPTTKVVSQENLITHKVKLLSKNKCPNCATTLSSKTSCSTCQSSVWSTGLLESYTSIVNKEALKYWLLAFLVAWIPYVGILFESLLVKLFIFRPYMVYNTAIEKLKGKFLTRLFKVILVILFGWVPFLGWIFMGFHYLQLREYRKNFFKNVK